MSLLVGATAVALVIMAVSRWPRISGSRPIPDWILLGILAVAVSAFAIASLLRKVDPESALIVSPFEVPSTERVGLAVTGKTVANLLVDELVKIHTEARVFAEGALSSAVQGKTSFDSLGSFSLPLASPLEGPSVEMEVGGFKIATGWDRIRRHQELITGDLIFSGSRLTLRAAMAAQTWEEGLSSTKDADLTDPDLKTACHRLARKILSDVKPEIAVPFYLGRGEFDEAKKVYGNWVSRDPRKAPPLFVFLNDLGSADAHKGHLREAIASYRKALALKPDFPAALNNLGNALANEGHLDEAIPSYRKALALKPDFPAAINNLGSALWDEGRLDEAIASYRKALRLKPDFPEALDNLGLALSQKDPEEAITRLLQALDARPDFPEALNNIGFFLNNKQRYDEAITYLQQAVQLRPNYPEALNNLGFALNKEERYDEAIPALRKALALKPQYYAPLRHLGDALAAKGQLDDAIASYRKALELKPDYARAHYGLAIVLRQEGQREAAKGELVTAQHYFGEARQHFAEAERLDPNLKPPMQ